MNWPLAFAIVGGIFGAGISLALFIHGFPDVISINILTNFFNRKEKQKIERPKDEK